MLKRIVKVFLGLVKYTALLLLVLLIGLVVYYNVAVSIDKPEIQNLEILQAERTQIDSNSYTLGKNWLRKNDYGIWEMYLEGEAFERGVVHGKLAKELVQKQEDNFVGQLKKMIPSEAYLRFLKYFIVWFNRDIDEHIVDEYQKEIYGVSFSASPQYTSIGSNYERILNYHAAHDIGHALQDKNLVPGCTAFSTWGSRSQDSSLIIGRNFDFYVGDAFAEDKIICFLKPDSGYKMMFVTWGGMTGVVSGMNEKGLTITLNASKSDMPPASATPISILAREILQYASNIDEAYTIALKRKTFVSEALMIGSALDNQTYIIEKSPTRQGLYQTSGQELLCSNHFQGETFNSEKDLKEQSSVYRYQRLQQLLGRYEYLNEHHMAAILRDQKGMDDRSIGMGNEKALNQLIAHHSIIFKPAQQLVWISANPYQLGAYVAYDLQKIFGGTTFPSSQPLYETALVIPADSFLLTTDYQRFLQYKKSKEILLHLQNPGAAASLTKLPDIDAFVATNPDFYYTYWLVGDYYRMGQKDFASAAKYYEIALTKEIPRVHETEYLQKMLRLCHEKIKKP
jgi:isopenicillin-N N-acyltransferase-like protein